MCLRIRFVYFIFLPWPWPLLNPNKEVVSLMMLRWNNFIFVFNFSLLWNKLIITKMHRLIILRLVEVQAGFTRYYSSNDTILFPFIPKVIFIDYTLCRTSFIKTLIVLFFLFFVHFIWCRYILFKLFLTKITFICLRLCRLIMCGLPDEVLNVRHVASYISTFMFLLLLWCEEFLFR